MKTFLKGICLETFAVIFSVVVAQAAPSLNSVAGTLSSGQTIQVQGSNFQTKSPAAPVVWADFEGGIDPSPLGQKQKWDEVQNMFWSSNGPGGSKGVEGTAGAGVWIMRVDLDAWTNDN